MPPIQTAETGIAIGDPLTGITAAWATTAALFARHRGGGAARVDVSMVEAVAATVVPREGEPPTVDDLTEHCRQLIAGFKVPRRIDITTDLLPKSAAGKILKRELREPFWVGHEARVSGA